MPKRQGVSLSVIRRLPRYYRFLGELLENGVYRISSQELAQIMNLTASQIRQDLNCFGGFGQQGYGYTVADLHHEIGKILQLDTSLPAILVGAGNLGRAVINHMDFPSRGFNLVGIFDQAPDVVGQVIGGLEVADISCLEELCRHMKPKAAILCIPKEDVQQVADQLIETGIEGFWNFSHHDFAMYHKDIVVENVHLSDSLMTLRYLIAEKKEQLD